MIWKATTLWCLLLLSSCGEDDNAPSCSGLQTHYYGGEAPNCSVGLECEGTRWDLDCTGTECSCVKNDSVEKTVPYEDRFCAPDFDTGADDPMPYIEAASDACGGWN